MDLFPEGNRPVSPELVHFVYHAHRSNIDFSPYIIPKISTHTEDGIPIRKLYVSNLPPKTTRSELFGVFAQYGFIKSCWLKMSDRGVPNKLFSPTFAFVTYTNPADAYKALLAPLHEKILRGRNLKISPADSWHQPVEDTNGVLSWKPRGQQGRVQNSPPVSPHDNSYQDINTNTGPSGLNNAEHETCNSEIYDDGSGEDVGSCNSLLDVLNVDCLTCILDYISLRELILSERVSKGWQNMVHIYFSNKRVFKTSSWPKVPIVLTTAVLRRILQKLGGSLSRLHIDHIWSVLNDRTAHTIGKFCPQLEELQVIGMHTKNWNPVIYGCSKLKRVSFVSCSKLADSSLVQMVKHDSKIESISIAHNTRVTGLFLATCLNTRIHSIAFLNCFKLSESLLFAMNSSLSNLTSLKLDDCAIEIWKVVPDMLRKLPKLRELSLTQYLSDEKFLYGETDQFSEALASVNRLQKLNLSCNDRITNAVLQCVADSCPYLEYLNVSGCNSKLRDLPNGVSDDGIIAVCRGCTVLQWLDVSHLNELTNAGFRNINQLKCLKHLIARGINCLTVTALVPCLSSCHQLQELDVCACRNVSKVELHAAVLECLRTNPRQFLLRLLRSKQSSCNLPSNSYLCVEEYDEISRGLMRPNFADSLYDDSSEDSFDDLLDQDDQFMDDNNFFVRYNLEEFLDYAFQEGELVMF